MYDPKNTQMANPNGSPFQLGTMMGPPAPRQMQVKTQMMKVPPQNPVIAPPEQQDTPTEQPVPVEATQDDGTVKTSVGLFKVKNPGEYYYDNGTHDIKIDAADAPPEVTAYAAKKYPAPGEIVMGDKRYKVTPDGKVQAFIGALNKWGDVPDDQVDKLPQEVRKPYYDSKNTSDVNAGRNLLSQPMFGGVVPNQQQVQQQEQNIQGISQQLSGNQGLQGISSPEQLDQARTQAEADLRAVQSTGDKARITAAKEKLQHLKDMKIVPTPEGGYIMYDKAPIGDQLIVHTVTPKEPKKGAEYDWTKDPMQVNAEAQTRAQAQNRNDVKQSSGGIIFNDSAQRIVNDYANSYSKWYRSQQLAGEHPSAPLPEILAQQLAKQMDPNNPDPDGAKETIIEMQKALAEVHGNGYLALKPNYQAMTSFNNGVSDYTMSRIPSQPENGYDVKSQIIANPKTAAGREKDIKEAPLVLPDPNGTLDHAETAIQKTINSMQVDPTNTAATLALHEQKLYNQPDAPIQNYVTPSGPRPDAADRATAFDQHIQERMTDPVFRKKFISSLANGIGSKVGQIELAHTNRSGSSTTRGQGDDAVTTTTYKDGPVQDSAYKEAMQNMFGAENYEYYDTANAKNDKDKAWNATHPTKMKWSDEGAVERYTQNFFKMSPEDQLTEVKKGGAYAKTLYMLEGVAAGRNGHMEIDSRLGGMAADEITKAAQATLLPEAQTFVRNNKAYFDANKKVMSDPDTRVNENELNSAINSNLVIRAISKMMGQTLQK